MSEVLLKLVNVDSVISTFMFCMLTFSSFSYMFLYSNFRLEDMKDQLRKKIFAKRIVKRITLFIANGLSIELNTYALMRPTTPGTHAFIFILFYCECFYILCCNLVSGNNLYPCFWLLGTIMWLDSVTNRPLKVMRYYRMTFYLECVHLSIYNMYI